MRLSQMLEKASEDSAPENDTQSVSQSDSADIKAAEEAEAAAYQAEINNLKALAGI